MRKFRIAWGSPPLAHGPVTLFASETYTFTVEAKGKSKLQLQVVIRVVKGKEVVYDAHKKKDTSNKAGQPALRRSALNTLIMNQRILRIPDGYWRITTPEGDIGGEEMNSLKCYLDQIQYPYEVDEYGIAIHGSILRSEIEPKLRIFYDGVADVIPF